MQAAQHVPPADHLERFDQAHVARLFGMALAAPVREGMRAGCDNGKTHRLRDIGDARAQACHLVVRLCGIGEDRRYDFDLGLLQFERHVLAEAALAGLDEALRHARSGMARTRVDEKKLFLDAEGECFGRYRIHCVDLSRRSMNAR